MARNHQFEGPVVELCDLFESLDTCRCNSLWDGGAGGGRYCLLELGAQRIDLSMSCGEICPGVFQFPAGHAGVDMSWYGFSCCDDDQSERVDAYVVAGARVWWKEDKEIAACDQIACARLSAPIPMGKECDGCHMRIKGE